MLSHRKNKEHVDSDEAGSNRKKTFFCSMVLAGKPRGLKCGFKNKKGQNVCFVCVTLETTDKIGL